MDEKKSYLVLIDDDIVSKETKEYLKKNRPEMWTSVAVPRIVLTSALKASLWARIHKVQDDDPYPISCYVLHERVGQGKFGYPACISSPYITPSRIMTGFPDLKGQASKKKNAQRKNAALPK